MTQDFSFIYYYGLLKKWRNHIIVICTVAMILAAVVTLMRPVVYTSTTTLLLTEGGGMSATPALGNFLNFAGLSTGSSSKDVIIAVLNSGRMSKDIRKQFGDKGVWWGIETYVVTAGLNVEIRGPDPALTEKIANFCIENLDKINNELNITLNKPMVKVLDPASYGSPVDKKMFNKIIAAGLFSFLSFSLYVFLTDFFKHRYQTQGHK